MAGETTGQSNCLNCGYEAPRGSEWGHVDHPTLGSLTRCPECGSTNVSAGR